MAGVDLKSLNKEDEEKIKKWIDQNDSKIQSKLFQKSNRNLIKSEL